MSRRGTLIGFLSLFLTSPTPVRADPTPPVLHVDVAPVAEDVVEQLVRRLRGPRLPTPAEILERLLDETGALLVEIEAEGRAGSGVSAVGRMLLAARIYEITSARLGVREQAAQMRTQLVAAGLADRAPDRDRALTRIEDGFDRLLGALEAVGRSATAAGRASAVTTARGILQGLRDDGQARQGPSAAQPVPTLTQDRPLWSAAPARSAPAPAYLAHERPAGHLLALADPAVAILPPPTAPEATTCAYAPGDLAATVDAPLTPEIRDLAASLQHSPSRIFRHVADRIAFQPYYGSLKGAIGTLYSGSGNATDHASLLIALLRAANVPARYVKGTASFANDPRLLRWLGAKTHLAAANILASGQIPTTYVASGSSVRFTHVWVEMCVPYGNYRGTGSDRSGHRWIPLDASFKEARYQPGIAQATGFDYATYMATRSNLLPHEKYAMQVETTVKGLAPNFANNTLADVPYAGTPEPRRLDILPASLPYPVVAFLAWDGASTADVAALPDSHRLKLEIIPERGVDAEPSSETARLAERSVILALPDIALKRVTLSFKGATTADQTALTSWQNDGNLSSAPPSINVTPIVKVDGVEQAFLSGTNVLTPIALGTTNNRLTLRVVLGEGAALQNGRPITPLNKITYRNIQAANYHALFAYAFQASDRLLRERAAKLLARVAASPAANATPDDTEGELLHLTGLKYMRYVTDAQARISALDGGSGQMGNHLGLTSTVSKVQYVLDEPFAVYRKGFLIDVPGLLTRSVDLATGVPVWGSFRLLGYTASAYESYIWQETLRTDAVSSVRGVQFARETGIPVSTIPPTSDPAAANVLCYAGNPQQPAGCPAAYLYSASDRATILNLLGTGYAVTVPRQLIQYQNWKGWVAIAEKNDTVTGAMSGSYLISGIYAGGYETLPVGVNSPGFNFGFDPRLDTGWVSSLAVPTVDEAPTIIGQGGGAGGLGATPYSLFAGDPVNLVTGNLYHAERDLAVQGRGGLSIVLDRSYNARKPQDGPFGFGWTHTYNQVLVFRDDNVNGAADAGDTDGITSSVSWIDGTGSEKIIQVTGESTTCGPGPGATFTAPPGYFFTVTRNTDLTYSLREKNGLTYLFEPVEGRVGTRARLMRITDRNGNSVTLTYGGTPSRLTSVRDDLGRALTFTYDAATGRITQVQDWTGRTYQYAYDAGGNLVAFKNPLVVSGLQAPVTYTYYTTGVVNHALASYTLPRGNGMTFEYYASGRVFRHSTTAGETTTFAYNDFRRETVVTNERGFTRRHVFDKYGNPTKIVQETGGELNYTYDTTYPLNRLTETNPLGYVTAYAYDTLGNVTQVTLPSASTVQYSAFNGFGQSQKIKDPRGNYTVLQYDLRGNLLQKIALRNGVGAAIANPGSYVPAPADVVAWTINTYDAYGNLRTTKQVRNAATQAGPTITYTYDASNLYPTQVSRAGDKNGDGTIDAPDTAPVAYDSLGRRTTAITPDWFPATMTYDAVDRIVTATDAVGQTRRFGYDPNGNRTFAGLPGLDVTTAGYDASDRKVVTTDAAGSATVYAYDAAGNVTQVTNPDGFTMQFVYDPLNRVVQALDQEGQSVSRALDLDGKPRTITDANGNTTSYAYYDSTRDGRLRATTNALGRATTYDYDANGNVVSLTDPASRVTLTTYDELNRPTRIAGPVLTDPLYGSIRPVTVFAYNLLGLKVQVSAGRTDAGGITPANDVVTTQMSYVWDDFGRKLRETDGLGRTWTMAYDVNNRPVSVVDAKGQRTTFAYDPGTRQLQTRTAGAHVTSYSRNGLGQVLTAVTPEVTYTYTYDAAHRLASVRDGRGNKTLTYDYSDGGLLNGFQDSDGNRTDYVYDSVGRLVEIWAPTNEVVTFAYDSGGRLVEKALPNGTKTRYTWNADNTLAQLVNLLGGTPISQHDYTYDAVGNRATHLELINGTTTPYGYAYDALSRLTTVTNTRTSAVLESYTYDVVNNRTSKTDAAGTVTAYVHDAANQLTQIRQTTPTGPLLGGLVYDGNGSLTKKCTGGTVTVGPTTCTGTTITDLSYDQLNRMIQATKTGISPQSYAYDDQGRRIQKTVGGVATNYLYTGSNIHASYTSAWGGSSSNYTHGAGTDTPILRTSAGGSQYYHQDGLGSVVALTNPDSTVAGSKRYDAWGSTVSTGGTVPVHGYTGREPDETDLVYYRARYYDPLTGRFTQRDPIGMSGGINPYLYANANPVTLTDPTGSQSGERTTLSAPLTPGMAAGQQGMPAGSGGRWLITIDQAGIVGIPTRIPDDAPTPTSTIATNGISMNFERAVDAMASMVDKADPSVRAFTLLYNPTEGILRDSIETLADKIGFTTSIAKQWAGMLQEAQANGKFLAVVFSQGGAVNASAVSYINVTGGGSLSNMGLVCYGCANNVAVSRTIFISAGINTSPSNVRYISNINDPVANLLSLSTGNPVRLILSILSVPFLAVPSMNPHAY